MIKPKIFCIGILFLLLVGCKQEGEMDKKEIETTATNVAVQYLKVEEDIDFVATDFEFADGDGVDIVSVNGHVKDNKKKKMSVVIDYSNDYEVQTVGRD
jgi:PBP1b-binding outer membrane lipoprotein LpoB